MNCGPAMELVIYFDGAKIGICSNSSVKVNSAAATVEGDLATPYNWLFDIGLYSLQGTTVGNFVISNDTITTTVKVHWIGDQVLYQDELASFKPEHAPVGLVRHELATKSGVSVEYTLTGGGYSSSIVNFVRDEMVWSTGAKWEIQPNWSGFTLLGIREKNWAKIFLPLVSKP